MPIYKAPVEDTLFLLNDVFQMEKYGNLPGFSDASPDVVEAVLGEAGKHARAAVGMAALPLNAAVEIDAILEIA